MIIKYLKTNSWVGLSLDAEHIYGTIDNIPVTRTITKKIAQEFNKKDPTALWMRHVGEETERFDNFEQMLPHAISLLKELGGDILLKGNPTYVEPKKIIFAPDNFEVEEINSISEDYHTFSKKHRLALDQGSEKHWKHLDQMNEKWSNLLTQQIKKQ